MKKFIGFLVFLLPIVLFFSNPHPNKLERFMERFYGDPYENPRYVQTRVEGDFGQRKISMVVVGRLKDWDNCEASFRRLYRATFDNCENCTAQSIDCDAHPQQRYLDILNGEQTVTTYLAIQPQDDSFRRLAILFWGLTTEESDQTCQTLKTMVHKSQGGKPLKLECVPGLLR